MEVGKISIRYARAIYEYALEQGNETVLYKGMQSLVKHFAAYPALRKAINDPTLSNENKIKLLIAACRIDSDKILKQAIKVIVENGRAYYMERIARMYEKEYRQSKGIVLAQLTTAGLASNNEAKRLLVKFLSKKINGQIDFETILNLDIIGGFILEIEDIFLDASVKRELNQIKISDMKASEVSDILKMQLKGINSRIKFEEIGKVLQVSDGIARIFGLSNAEAGELLQFDSGDMAVVMNLEEDNVGAVLLGETSKVQEGDRVKRTKRIVSIPMKNGMLGRVVNPFGRPLDGKGPILGEVIDMPLERKAPGVIYRCPVSEPLQTGLKSIDAMIPIGRGQRELIIGDRQAGKTAISIDTIINQKANYEAENPVYCIYVAIGQKASNVANIVNTLKEYGALNYTIIVVATASDPASMQFYAPFAGAAIGEFFRDTGRHALVVYDDLSKHAVAYREVSLVLRRPSGREAYPGDIFYLHSRLLERAAKIINSDSVAANMNDLPDNLKGKVKGGGSLTALPIIETQAGDVSAYIPTNVISITDGQIFLETGLFNAGIRPAVNVGISVSRVGGKAQIKAMKKVAGTLKIDQAQYRELEAFTKFGGDMDAVTRAVLDKGRKNVELLIQSQYNPLSVEKEVAIIYIGIKGLLSDVPVERVREFETAFLDILEMKYRKDVLDMLKQGVLNEEIEKKLNAIAIEVAENFK